MTTTNLDRLLGIAAYLEFPEELQELIPPESDGATRELAKWDAPPPHPFINRPWFDFKKFGSLGFGQDRTVIRRDCNIHVRNLHPFRCERAPLSWKIFSFFKPLVQQGKPPQCSLERFGTDL